MLFPFTMSRLIHSNRSSGIHTAVIAMPTIAATDTITIITFFILPPQIIFFIFHNGASFSFQKFLKLLQQLPLPQQQLLRLLFSPLQLPPTCLLFFWFLYSIKIMFEFRLFFVWELLISQFFIEYIGNPVFFQIY